MRRLLGTSLALLVAGAAACGGSGAAPVHVQGNPDAAKTSYAMWGTYHNSRDRHGYSATMPHVSGAPKVVKTLHLDGAVYASPLVINGVTIVATENNTVYAFSSTFKQLWKRHLGGPSPASERPCGDIDPLGITGTPMYDSHYNSVYVAAEYRGTYHGLVSLNFTTGAVRWHKPIDFAGVDRSAMQQRGAITVDQGRVWVPFGGLAGDCGNYKGRVIGLLRSTGRSPLVYTVPTAREAGIWTPPGPTLAADGNLLVEVGNGASGVGDKYDYSDSVLEISAKTAKLVHHFSPTTWAHDNDNDLDLGSQGPAVVGNYVFADGKSGTAYVLRRTLGGVGGQVSSRSLCTSFGGTAVLGNVVYVPCTDGVRAVRISSSGTMQVLWHGSPPGSPVIGGGRVWSIDPGAGVLDGLSLSTGKTLEHVSVGQTSRFATPALYGRQVYVPTLSGLTVVRTS